MSISLSLIALYCLSVVSYFVIVYFAYFHSGEIGDKKGKRARELQRDKRVHKVGEFKSRCV